ncbi:MAG: hypothetical protein R3C49_07665 [Planctomycetaceae bacterium]
MKNLGGKLPPDLLNSVPPGMVERAMSDPEMRRQVADMLEQYARNHQLPSGNGGGSFPFLPPTADQQRSSNSGADSDSRTDGHREGPPGANSSEAGSRNSQRGDRPLNQDQTDRSNSQRDRTESENETFQQLKDLYNKMTGGRSELSSGATLKARDRSSAGSHNQPHQSANSPRTASQTPQSSVSGPPSNAAAGPSSSDGNSGFQDTPRSTASNSNPRVTSPRSAQPVPADAADNDPYGTNRLPSTVEEIDEWLENQSRRQKGLPPLPRGDRPANQFDPGSAAGTPGSPATDSTDQNSRTSVAEFLKQIRQNGIPEPPPSTGSQGSTASPGQSAISQTKPPADRSSASNTSDNSEAVRKLQKDVKNQLQNRGFRDTLRKMVQEARQEVQSAPTVPTAASGEPPTDTSGASSWVSPEDRSAVEQAVIRSLDGIGKDLLEIAKDAKFTPREQQPGGSPRPSPGPPPCPETPSAVGSLINDFHEGTKGFLEDLAAIPTPDLPTPPTSGSAVPKVAISGGSLSALWLPLTVIGVLMLVLLAWNRGVLTSEMLRSVSEKFAGSNDIVTRRDLVRAFNRMALSPSGETQTWWTHQMVQQNFAEKQPDKTAPIEQLTRLYEWARYLPDDQPLTPEQLHEARAALRQCES